MIDVEVEAEELGSCIDELDSLAHALQMNIPDKLHVECLRGSLPDLVRRMKKYYASAIGTNPWEDQP